MGLAGLAALIKSKRRQPASDYSHTQLKELMQRNTGKIWEDTEKPSAR
jgi:hypothetical protein